MNTRAGLRGEINLLRRRIGFLEEQVAKLRRENERLNMENALLAGMAEDASIEVASEVEVEVYRTPQMATN